MQGGFQHFAITHSSVPLLTLPLGVVLQLDYSPVVEKDPQ
jgi:hypothetical protein